MKRDKNLDCTKGFACILMIFAHAHGYGKTIDNEFTLFLYQIGLFAPILFLGATGISMTYQIRKRPYLRIIISYVFLFMISFANTGLRYINYINLSDWNLYACISLSALTALLFYKYINLFTIFIPILIYFFLRNMNITTSLFYGGLFSLIPWTAFVLIGLYLHFHKKYIYTFFILAVISLLFLMPRNGFRIVDNYNTPLYISSGIAVYTLSLIIMPFILKIKWIGNLLTYLGKNSLLFYIIHRLLVIYLPYRLFAPILWVLLFTTTVLLIPTLKKINKYFIEKYSHTMLFWVIIVIAVLVPFVFSMGILVQRAIMFVVLILHALNYHVILNIDIFSLKKRNQ